MRKTLEKLLAEYGVIAAVLYFTIFFLVLGGAYVAVENGMVIGWCDVFSHWAYAIAHVGSLGMGVRAEYRGRGIGERLLRATLAHAEQKGIFRVTLEARADNRAAIRLYEKVGFRIEARTPCALRFDDTFYEGVQMALLQGPASAA